MDRPAFVYLLALLACPFVLAVGPPQPPPIRLVEFGSVPGQWGVLAFSPDGRTLAVGDGEKSAVVLYEAASLLERGRLPLPTPADRAIKNVAFLNHGRWAVVAYQARVVVWDMASRKPILSCPADEWWGARCAAARLGELVAIVWQHHVVVWNARTGKRLGEVRGHTKSINSAAFSPDGKYLATVSIDETARLWDTANLRECAVLRGHGGSVEQVEFSPSGKALATAGGYSGDYSVCLWDVPSGKKRLTWDGHSHSIQGLAFLWDGRYLAIDQEATEVRAFDLALSSECAILEGVATGWGPASTTSGGYYVLAFGSRDEVSLFRCEAPCIALPRAAGPRRPWASFVPKRTRALWVELASADAARAYRASHALASSPTQALRLFNKELCPARGPPPGLADLLVRGLASDEYEARQRSEAGLKQLGEYAAASLRRATLNPDLEVRLRAERLLALHFSPLRDPKRLREVRAVEVLERIGTREARELLESLASGHPDARLTREALSSLTRMEAVRP
jgi:hypothetical protein